MSADYDQYLAEHRANVVKAYEWLSQNVPFIHKYDQPDVTKHDASKNDPEEYQAYDTFFYKKRNDRSSSVVIDFNKAWLRHIQCNAHHWQHWVLIHDPGEEHQFETLEMPEEDVIEMVCDWLSFGFKSQNLHDAIDYHELNKKQIMLHHRSRRLLENIMYAVEEKIHEGAGDLWKKS